MCVCVWRGEGRGSLSEKSRAVESNSKYSSDWEKMEAVLWDPVVFTVYKIIEKSENVVKLKTRLTQDGRGLFLPKIS